MVFNFAACLQKQDLRWKQKRGLVPGTVHRYLWKWQSKLSCLVPQTVHRYVWKWQSKLSWMCLYFPHSLQLRACLLVDIVCLVIIIASANLYDCLACHLRCERFSVLWCEHWSVTSSPVSTGLSCDVSTSLSLLLWARVRLLMWAVVCHFSC